MSMDPLNDLMTDLKRNWRPSLDALAVARKLYLDDSRGEIEKVVFGQVLPGKAHGVWVLGQRVVTVDSIPLVVKPGIRYSIARDTACDVAAIVLSRDFGGNGSTGWCCVYRDGTYATFED